MTGRAATDHAMLVRAARTGAEHRARHGAPPMDADEMASWLLPTFRIHVGHFVRTGRQIAGAWKALRQPGSLAGMIMLQPDLPYPRWTLAHEWGHYATGSSVGYTLQADGMYRACLPEERAANACAVAWLVPGDDLQEMVLAGQRRAEIAAHYGIPEKAVLLREMLMPALGEHWPLLDAVERALLSSDPWAGDRGAPVTEGK